MNTTQEAPVNNSDDDQIVINRRSLIMVLTALVGVPLGAIPGGAIGWAQGNSLEDYRFEQLSAKVETLTEKVDGLQNTVSAAGMDRWTRSEHLVFETGIEIRLKELEEKVLLLEHGKVRER